MKKIFTAYDKSGNVRCKLHVNQSELRGPFRLIEVRETWKHMGGVPVVWNIDRYNLSRWLVSRGVSQAQAVKVGAETLAKSFTEDNESKN